MNIRSYCVIFVFCLVFGLAEVTVLKGDVIKSVMKTPSTSNASVQEAKTGTTPPILHEDALNPEPFSKTGNVNSLLEESRPQTGRVDPLSEETNTKKVVAEGTAKIFNGDVQRARLMALRTAYAEAVGRVCGLEIGSMTVINNVKQVADIVMSRSRGFVKKYRIIREGMTEGDPTKYEVLIEAEVLKNGVAKEETEGLSLYLELLNNPRLLIILPEQNVSLVGLGSSENSEKKVKIDVGKENIQVSIDKTDNQQNGQHGDLAQKESADKDNIFRSSEAALSQVFLKYGYQVITCDELLSQGICEPEVLAQARAGVTTQAIKVARAAGADVVILGVLRISQESVRPQEPNPITLSVETSARAFIVSTGKTFQAFHFVQQKSSATLLKAYADCLENMANNIGDTLAWKIPKILTEEQKEISLEMTGINYDQTIKLWNAFKTFSEAENIRLVKVPTAVQQKAEFIISTSFIGIDNEEIIDSIQNTLKIPVTIKRMEKYRIECSVSN